MQSPPHAVFHDKYHWEIWKNTAGKSANFLLNGLLFLFLVCQLRFPLPALPKGSTFLKSGPFKRALSLFFGRGGGVNACSDSSTWQCRKQESKTSLPQASELYIWCIYLLLDESRPYVLLISNDMASIRKEERVWKDSMRDVLQMKI